MMDEFFWLSGRHGNRLTAAKVKTGILCVLRLELGRTRVCPSALQQLAQNFRQELQREKAPLITRHYRQPLPRSQA